MRVVWPHGKRNLHHRWPTFVWAAWLENAACRNSWHEPRNHSPLCIGRLSYSGPSCIGNASFGGGAVKQCKGKRPEISVHTEKQFWALIDQSGGHDACWPWLGSYSGQYGSLYWGEKPNRRQISAPRLAAFLTTQRISGRVTHTVTRHLCGNRHCCNPAHLAVGTYAENYRDSVDHGTARANPNPLRGEQTKAAKLTDAIVHQLRAKVASGRGFRSLGREYGVSHHTIANAVRRITWGHI